MATTGTTMIGRSPLVLGALVVGLVLAGCGTDTTGDAAAQSVQTVTATVTAEAPTQQATTVTVTAEAPAVTDATNPVGCAAADLDITLGDEDAAAGSVYTPIVFTNTSPVPCIIGGFPYVSYLAAADGPSVGSAARPNGPMGPAVVLQPGEHATSTLQAPTDAHLYPEDVCDPTAVTILQVYPPSSTQSVELPLPDGRSGCAEDPDDESILSVTAVQ